MKSSLICTAILFFLSVCVYAEKPASKCNIVFIGNSITQGVILKNPQSEAPPAVAVKCLEEMGYVVKYANCGKSGNTTVDFLPATDTYFRHIINAADTLYEKGVPLVFSIMLGTNDSATKGPNGSPVSPKQYQENLALIIDSLHARYPLSLFVLHRPVWYSPNTHNGASYLEEGLARLESYTPHLDALAKNRPSYVYKGDRDAFGFFKKHATTYFFAENGRSGVFYLHPNVAGAEKLGAFWAKSLKKRITP